MVIAHRHGWARKRATSCRLLAGVGDAFIAFVLPLLVDPEGLPIRGYGVMLLSRSWPAWALRLYRARASGPGSGDHAFAGDLVVHRRPDRRRLFYVIEYWDKFQRDTLAETLLAMVNVTQGGLVVYGSLLAGGAALIVFVCKYHLPGLALADLIAPGVMLGVGLGRIGCFLNGCCYGGISDLPWAVQFPPGSPAYIDQVQRGELYVHGLMFHGLGDDPPP